MSFALPRAWSSVLVIVLLILPLARVGLGAAEGPALVVPNQSAAVAALPVLHAGRVKPFAIAAEESLLAITTKTAFGEVETRGLDRVVSRSWSPTDLVAAMLLAPQDWGDRPLIGVPWKPLQERLKIPGQWATINELKPHQAFFAELEGKQQRRQNELVEWTTDDEKAWEVADRWSRALDLLAGRTIALAPLAANEAERAEVLKILGPAVRNELSRDREWRATLKRAYAQGERGGDALRQQDPWLTFEDLVRDPDPLLTGVARLDRLRPLAAAFGGALAAGGDGTTAPTLALSAELRAAGEARALERLGESVTAGNAATYPSAALLSAELSYHRARPFTIAWLTFILGGLLTGWGLSRQKALALNRPSRLVTAGTVLTAVGCLVTVAGLAVRHWITGLGAVTNLYETFIYVSLLVALLGLGFARMSGNGLYAVCGGVGAGLCAMVGEAMPPELGSQIGQLQPVLRSRFWLWLHVKVVVAAYAPYVLALVLGNVVLWKAWRGQRAVTADEGRLLYRCLQWGTVLMAAGTLLGGVWADQAWGRFWGWDPKEVGALTIVLCYLIPLHLRYVGIVGPTGLAAWSVLGFLSVLWSWYGVNFVLGAGLHAYAFGSGGQWLILPLAGAQCVLTAVQLAAIPKATTGRPATPG